MATNIPRAGDETDINVVLKCVSVVRLIMLNSKNDIKDMSSNKNKKAFATYQIALFI